MFDGKKLSPWASVPKDFLTFVQEVFPKATVGDRLLLMAIVLKQPKPFMSSSYLAEASGLHQKTVMASLKNLRELGIIVGERRVKMGGPRPVQEIDITPLNDLLVKWREERAARGDPEPLEEFMAEPAVASEPKMIRPLPAPIGQGLSDEEFAKKLGPPGATAEQARVVRDAMDATNMAIANAGEIEPEDEIPDGMLARAARVAEATLPATKAKDVVKFKKSDYPRTSGERQVLSMSSLLPEALQTQISRALQYSVRLCYPMWGESATLDRLHEIVVEQYQAPARSHEEVWIRIQNAMDAWVRNEAQSRQYSVMAEALRFSEVFGAYCEDCQKKGKEPEDFEIFREAYYRNGEHRSFDAFVSV